MQDNYPSDNNYSIEGYVNLRATDVDFNHSNAI